MYSNKTSDMIIDLLYGDVFRVSQPFICITTELDVQSFMKVKTDNKTFVIQLSFALKRIPRSVSGL
jgi:hypothetical protein